MVDIHTHILYNIDDGSKSKEETIEMLKIAIKDGIKTIFATPHYIYGVNSYTANQLENRYNEIVQYIKEEKLPLQLILGNEVFLDENIVDALITGDCHTLGDSNYVLTECYNNAKIEFIKPILYKMMLNNYKPIIAHVERLIHCQDDIEKIEELKDIGCLLQVNAGSITHSKSRNDKKIIYKLLKDEKIDFIASDAHNTRSRKPGLKKAYTIVSKKFGQTLADDVFINNPNMIIHNYTNAEGGTACGTRI